VSGRPYGGAPSSGAVAVDAAAEDEQFGPVGVDDEPGLPLALLSRSGSALSGLRRVSLALLMALGVSGLVAAGP
jgi:hypothetical protein